MKRFRFQILFFLRRSRKNKMGEYPIYLRVTINGSQSTVFTGRSIKSQAWNVKQGRVRGSKDSADEINKHLDSLQTKIFKEYSSFEKQGMQPSAKRIIEAISGRGENIHTLLQAYEYHNKKMAAQVGKGIAAGSFKNHRLTYRHLKEFIPKYNKSKDISLTELGGQFISEFDHYLRVKKNNSQNGSMKNLVRLKKIILLSINNDWMAQNPFRAYKIKFKKTDRVYLNAVELKRLEEYKPPTPKLLKVQDIFVFSCYTGLAYTDVKALTSENLVTGVDGNVWIIGKRGKSGVRFTMPLLPKAIMLLKKYHVIENDEPKAVIFPVMSNQKMNDYLKDIAKLCGISKPISFHSARHTFATTVTLVNGVPIETVSKMLGHTDLATTQVYARVIDEKIATDMKALQEKLR